MCSSFPFLCVVLIVPWLVLCCNDQDQRKTMFLSVYPFRNILVYMFNCVNKFHMILIFWGRKTQLVYTYWPGCELDDLGNGVFSWQEQKFFSSLVFRSALVPTHSLGTGDFSWRVTRLGHETGCSPPSNAEINNVWSYISHSPPPFSILSGVCKFWALM